MSGKKHSCYFLNQSAVKPNPIRNCSHAFCRAWRQLKVSFATSSDWSIVLFISIAIAGSNYFGSGFLTLNWKPFYDLMREGEYDWFHCH